MEKKQIVEEMARIICKPTSNKGNCDKCGFKKQCSKFDDATDLYNAGCRKQSGWISVVERLPEEYDIILCFNGSYVQASVFLDGEFIEDDKYEGDPIRGVTHWMPLPEAPKGGAE